MIANQSEELIKLIHESPDMVEMLTRISVGISPKNLSQELRELIKQLADDKKTENKFNPVLFSLLLNLPQFL